MAQPCPPSPLPPLQRAKLRTRNGAEQQLRVQETAGAALLRDRLQRCLQSLAPAVLPPAQTSVDEVLLQEQFLAVPYNTEHAALPSAHRGKHSRYQELKLTTCPLSPPWLSPLKP